MSFKDKFAITKINEQISFSIDEFKTMTAVMLIVPDKNKHDHDHIEFPTKKELKAFVDALYLKRESFINARYYRLEAEACETEEKQIKLDINQIEDNKKIFMYSIHLSQEDISKIQAWSDEYSSKTQAELRTKYETDLKR